MYYKHCKHKLSPTDVDELCDLYQKGWKLTWLSAKYNIDHTSVLYHVKKRKIVQEKKLNSCPTTHVRVSIKQNYKLLNNVVTMPHNVPFTYDEIVKRSRKRERTTLHDKECPHTCWMKRCSMCKAILESDSQCNVNEFGYTRDIYNDLDKIVCSYQTSQRLTKHKVKQNSTFYWVYYEKENMLMLKTKMYIPEKTDKDVAVYAAFTVQELYAVVHSLNKQYLTNEFLLDIAMNSTDPNYIARRLLTLIQLHKIKV